jgi:hypothetical protein
MRASPPDLFGGGRVSDRHRDRNGDVKSSIESDIESSIEIVSKALSKSISKRYRAAVDNLTASALITARRQKLNRKETY